MTVAPSDSVEVRQIVGKGRGVFARRPIRKGEVIERAPVLVLPLSDVMRGPDDWTGLGNYCFEWGKDRVALALGFGSLYNHSFRPNARYDDEARRLRIKVFSALRDIEPGEEVTINYNGDPDDDAPVWFRVIERNRRRKSGSGSSTGG